MTTTICEHEMHEVEPWYAEWLDKLEEGDNVYVGARNGRDVYLWSIAEIDGNIALINKYEFDLDNGFGAPGKLLFPTEQVVERFQKQGLAASIAEMASTEDLNRLNKDQLLELRDFVMQLYDEVGHAPRGMRSRERRSAHRPRNRRTPGPGQG